MKPMSNTLGPYRLLGLLGRGGMGAVYRAEPIRGGAPVAVKTVERFSGASLPFLRLEIHALSRLRHPGIVRILDSGVHAGVPWFAMELIEGPGSRHLTRAALPEVLTMFRRLCEALAYLHGEGIVHRDLKPENILLRNLEVSILNSELERHSAQSAEIQNSKFKIQNSPWPVLVDFGIAAAVLGPLSRESLGSVAGSSGSQLYMAPEQIRGELLDARADLYALGCVMYELLSGTPPFTGTAWEVLQAHQEQMPVALAERVPGLPVDLSDLVQRLLAKDPRERLGYASDVAAGLARLGAIDGGAAAGSPPRTYLYRPGFHGRAQALGRLEQRLGALLAGDGGVVLVGGESGAGKTRLVLELGRQAERSGIRVLGGECLEAAGPLHALQRPLQAVADQCRAWGPQEAQRLLGRRVRLLEPYEPALAGIAGLEAYPAVEAQDLASLPPDAARLRLYTALSETFTALASAAPVLLILDDLQWADELTAGFVEHWLQAGSVAAQGRAPLLLAGTYRSEDVGAHGLAPLQRLAGLPGMEVVPLGRLDEAAVGAMVGDMLALRKPPGLFVRFLSLHTEGNPFFVAEYLRAAVAEALLYRDAEGFWQVAEPGEAVATMSVYEALSLPRSLRALVERRLEGLGPDARRLLDAASVLGREVDVRWLKGMSRLPEPRRLDALAELLRRQVLEEAGSGRLRFLHDKIREVAYDRLPRRRRVQLHRSAAVALAKRPPPEQREHAAALGLHWERAGEPDKAVPRYEQAARAAVARHAQEEGKRLFRACLALTRAPTRQSVEVRDSLAIEILYRQGRLAEALEEQRRALAETAGLGAPDLEAQVLRGLGILHRELGHAQESLACFERALALFQAAGLRAAEARTLFNLALLHEQQERTEEAIATTERALELYRGVSDRRWEAYAAGTLGKWRCDAGRFEEAQALLQRALDLGRELEDRELEAYALDGLAKISSRQGRFEEARHVFEQALEVYRMVGNRVLEGNTLGEMATLCHEQRRLEEALELAEQCLAVHRQADHRLMEGYSLRIAAGIHRDRGGLARARDCWQQALDIFRERGHRSLEAETLRDLADLDSFEAAR